MISVVIPTRDRRAALVSTLARLGEQQAPAGGYEVVVVDNGSTDDTLAALETVQRDFPVPLTTLSEPTPGPAAARNAGFRAASGEIVLFLGDDMEPADDTLVRGHASFHASHAELEHAVVGAVAWHPRRPVTPFMAWLESGGSQFNLEVAVAGPIASQYFYTSNVSLKRALLLQVGGFDARFPFAAVEDTEIGTRLALAGMQLSYDPGLVVLHDHPQEPEAWAGRMAKVGQSARLYNTLWPDRPLRGLPEPTGVLWVLARVAAPVATALGRLPVGDSVRRRVWQIVHLDAYAWGYRSGPPEPGRRGEP